MKIIHFEDNKETRAEGNKDMLKKDTPLLIIRHVERAIPLRITTPRLVQRPCIGLIDRPSACVYVPRGFYKDINVGSFSVSERPRHT